MFEHAGRAQPDRAQPDRAQLDKGIGRRPAIIFFFGGFWSVGAAEQFYPFARYFAERGYVALAVDYRVRWLHGTNVPVAVSDAAAALRWVADHADALNVDPARIVVAGSSSGGHMAAAAALGLAGESAPPVAAMVLLNPAVDTSFDNAPAIWRIVEPLFETKGRSLSPLHRLQRGAPPTLIFHGRSDRLVPIDQSRRFCAAMRDLGGVCDLREIAGAGHAFFNYGFGHFDEVAAGSADFLTRTFDRQEQERRGVR